MLRVQELRKTRLCLEPSLVLFKDNRGFVEQDSGSCSLLSLTRSKNPFPFSGLSFPPPLPQAPPRRLFHLQSQALVGPGHGVWLRGQRQPLAPGSGWPQIPVTVCSCVCTWGFPQGAPAVGSGRPVRLVMDRF